MNDSQQIEIKVDVKWYGNDIPHGLAGAHIYRPAYRIFVDSDLLTERTFIWQDQDSYIEELIIVKLQPGLHEIKVEKLNDLHELLRIGNVRINDVPSGFQFSV